MANKLTVANLATQERVEISNGVFKNGQGYYLSKSMPKDKWCDKYHVRVVGEQEAGAYTKYLIEPQDGWDFLVHVDDKTKGNAPAAPKPKKASKAASPAPKAQESAPAPSKYNTYSVWNSFKSQSPDVAFLIKDGGSYVTYNDDAKILADKLGFTMTNKGGVRSVSFPEDMLKKCLPVLNKSGKHFEIVDDPMKASPQPAPSNDKPAEKPESTDQGDASGSGNEVPAKSPAPAPKEEPKASEQKIEKVDEIPADAPDEKAPAEEIPASAEPDDNIDETAKAIAEALRQARMKNNGKGEIDEEKVRKIVQETLEDMAKTDPVKVRKVQAKAQGKNEYRHPMFDKVLAMVANDRVIGRFPWLYGPAGSGKSTLAQQIADALGLPFYSVSSLQQKYELEGYSDAVGKLVETTFHKAFNEGGVFIFDEMSTTSGEVQVAFNTAVAQLVYNFPVDGMTKAHKDFHIIAADNTTGWGGDKKYHARFELDASTLDRYIPVHIDYTDAHDLGMARCDKELVDFLKDIRRILDDADLIYTASPRVSKCIKSLQEIGMYTDQEIIKFGLCGGWSASDIRTVAARLNGNTKYHKIFKSLSK